MKSIYYREQKHICGRNYATAPYMEVDLYPVTPKQHNASTLYIDDVAYWERKYPGYTLNRVETRVSNAGWRHTTVIMRRAECWHGTPGRKVTPRMNR